MNTRTIDEILDDPCTSYWLKNAIKTSFKRDLLDALRDAELLTKLLNDLWQEVEKIYWKAQANGAVGFCTARRIAELENWTKFFPSRAEWETAKSELIALGYLNKAGVITVKGKNAR